MTTAAVTTSHVATGAGSAITPIGKFNYSVSGTFVGTIKLQRSFDSGATWVDWSSVTAVTELVLENWETTVQYRTNCSAYTSGTAIARVSY